MAGGAEMEAALVDFDAVQDLDILRGVFDQGEIESLVGNRFTADQGARGGTRLGVTLKMPSISEAGAVAGVRSPASR